MHHRFQIKMHHQLLQVQVHQRHHQDHHMEDHHNNMVILEDLDLHTRPDHQIRVILDNHQFSIINILHSMAIRDTLADIQDSPNIMDNSIPKVNTLNITSTVIITDKGTPDIMDIKIIMVTKAKRIKTKV